MPKDEFDAEDRAVERHLGSLERKEDELNEREEAMMKRYTKRHPGEVLEFDQVPGGEKRLTQKDIHILNAGGKMPGLIGLCPGEHFGEFYMPLEMGDSMICPQCELVMFIYTAPSHTPPAFVAALDKKITAFQGEADRIADMDVGEEGIRKLDAMIAADGALMALRSLRLEIVGTADLEEEIDKLDPEVDREKILRAVMAQSSAWEHRVEIADGNFAIQHPVFERAGDKRLLDCPLNDYLASLDGPPVAPGFYHAWCDEDGDWIFTPAGDDRVH